MPQQTLKCTLLQAKTPFRSHRTLVISIQSRFREGKSPGLERNHFSLSISSLDEKPFVDLIVHLGFSASLGHRPTWGCTWGCTMVG